MDLQETTAWVAGPNLKTRQPGVADACAGGVAGHSHAAQAAMSAQPVSVGFICPVSPP
jgi:hypothetical protein